MSISTSYGQRKSKKAEVEQVKKIEFTDLAEILSRKEELKLNSKQIAAFTIKNEYVKRDLQSINSKTKMEEVEKNKHRRDLFDGYNSFINRTLDEDQLETWNKAKKEMAEANIEHTDLKTELKELDAAHAIQLKEIYRKYSKDRKIYYATRDVAKKQYSADRARIYAKYNQTEEEGVEGEKVLTLEEIALLTKEFDESYGQQQASPLEYLDIKEETSTEESEEYTPEGDY
jgi:hypothetical protein